MRKNLLVILLLIGATAGALCGWWFGPRMEAVAFIGDFFLTLLWMLVVPLILFSMIAGVASLGDIRRVGGIGLKTLFYYFSTTAAAVFVGLVLVSIIQPGRGIAIVGSVVESSAVQAGFVQILNSFIHPNIVQAMAETKILPIIVISIAFGAALTTLGERGRAVIRICETINQAILVIVRLVMWLAPVGVFALVAAKLGASGGGDAFLAELAKVGKYTATVIIGLGIHAVVVLPLILWIFGRRNPLTYAWGMIEALVTAFSTSSSSATLPVTLEALKDRNHVKEAAADFVAPIGATINMDGTALYEAVAAMFIAQRYGIELSFFQQFLIFITATLASIGAAGIPQAGLITMVIVLEAVGLPREGIGIILAVDWFLDRCRTTVNVWGDSVGAAVIERVKEMRG